MSKLTKFLTSHGTLTKTNPSGSSYYLLGDQKVRVSDHLSLFNIDGVLNILLPQGTNTQYVVVLLGSLYVHTSFTSLRVFLEHYLLISKAFSKKKSVNENDKIVKQRETIDKLSKELAQVKSIKEKKGVVFTDSSLSSLTDAQKKIVVNFIKTNSENHKI